jgi:DNA-directed RNA polymerase specialized sigma24 family protein
MESHTRSPFEDQLERLDLKALHSLARGRLQGRLDGFEAAEIENGVQEVMLGFTETVRRSGIERSAEGLVVQIVRNVAADMIKERQRERVGVRAYEREPVEHSEGLQDEEELSESIRRTAFFLIEYWRLKRARCIPLAEVKKLGKSLKEHAHEHGLSYAKVRQDWSRCARLVLEAIRKGRLKVDWYLPSSAGVRHEQ